MAESLFVYNYESCNLWNLSIWTLKSKEIKSVKRLLQQTNLSKKIGNQS